jgi:hypothetical protein
MSLHEKRSGDKCLDNQTNSSPKGEARSNSPGDYLGLDDLLAVGLCPEEANAILRWSDVSGHGGQPVIEAERLHDLLADIRDSEDRLPTGETAEKGYERYQASQSDHSENQGDRQ